MLALNRNTALTNPPVTALRGGSQVGKSCELNCVAASVRGATNWLRRRLGTTYCALVAP